MPIKISIPTSMRRLTNNQAEVEAIGSTVEELFNNLNKQYPGMKEQVYDENRKLRRFINVYVNDEDIRFLDGDETVLKDGDIISIIPAIAGG